MSEYSHDDYKENDRRIERMQNIWKAIGIGFLAATIIFPVASIAWYYSVPYPDYIYPIDRAQGYIKQAQATNNFDQISQYMGLALMELEGHSGNPAWIWPTPDVNIDLIKGNMEKIIVTAEAMKAEGLGSMAYHQSLQNTHEQALQKISHNLDHVGDWLVGTPSAVAMIIIAFIFPITALGILFVKL